MLQQPAPASSKQRCSTIEPFVPSPVTGAHMIRSTSVVALVVLANGLWAQANPPTPRPSGVQRPPAPARKDTTPGFAINDQAVISSCVRCHVRDSTGLMERLSYLRKTPEGWEISMRRMVALQNVRVDPASAAGTPSTSA